MNKSALLLFLTLFCGLSVYSQDFSIIGKSSNSLTIQHHISAFSIEDAQKSDLNGQCITLQGITLPNEAGAPDMPSFSTFVAIPNGATATLSIKSSQKEFLHDIDLTPAPIPQLDNDDSPAVYEKNPAIYNTDAFYPATPYRIVKTLEVRGMNIVQVGVMPFQYNPVTKELIVYKEMDLQVDYEGGSGEYGDIRYRTPEWDQILSDMLLNREVLPSIDYGARLRQHYENRESGYEYVIITPDNDEFVQLADSIRLFRTAQGVPTGVFTVSECGGNDYRRIRNFIRNAYNTWDMPPAAILLLGDHNADGTQGIVSYTMNNHPGGGSYNPYISDHAYSDPNNDMMPDIIMARITGRTYEEMYHMIKKDLDYERTPPTNPDFYDKPVTAMGFQLERWFQLCSEIVNGFWEYELEKHPVRLNAIYQGTPGSRWSTADNTNSIISYFGQNGCGYIPNTMSHLKDWDANGQMINDAINNGAFLIQHRDHGAEEVWGEPSYGLGHIHRLTNKDLTYVMSNNCLTGRFNYAGTEGCFAEVFHRHQYGALGLIAATQVSYSFVNDVYVWGAYDNMWPDFMPTYGTEHETNFLLPAFGNEAGKYFLARSSWADDGVKEITYYLFHQHGDAYMNIYSEMPQNLNVDMLPIVKANQDFYEVCVDQNATICLTVNGEIIGFDYGTGRPQRVAITPQEPGTEILMTITKQNYYRYEHKIAVIPTTGPYLIFHGINSINDETAPEPYTAGDGDHEVDYREFVRLGIKLLNVGESSDNNYTVTISSNSQQVVAVNNSITFQNIGSNETLEFPDAFGLYFNDFEDGEKARLYLDILSEEHHFRDSIDIEVKAPRLIFHNAQLTDMEGHPIDRFEKGESSLLHIEIENAGHSATFSDKYYLSIKAPFLDIPQNEIITPIYQAGESFDAIYQVNIHEDAPYGGILCYELKGDPDCISSGTLPLGYTIEDFDDDALNPNLQWNLGSGSKRWAIDENDYAVTGSCLCSPSLTYNQASNLIIGVTTNIDDKVSFYRKTNTNASDIIQITIDTEIVDSWDGENDWERVEYELPAGIHLLKIKYQSKTNGGIENPCVKIDHLCLPPMAEIIIFAGNDDTTCSHSTFQPQSYCLNAQSISWSSEGDGYFDDPTLEQPSYTPGENDIENGHTTLIMTAISELNGTEQSDQVELSFIPDISTISAAMPEGDTLVDLYETSSSSYRLPSYTQGELILHGSYSLRPEEAGDLTIYADSILVTWNPQFVGKAFIGQYYDNDCTHTEITELEVTVKNSTGLEEANNETILFPNPTKGIVTIQGIEADAHIRLFDLNGRMLLEQTSEENSIQLNLSNLNKGMYLMTILEKSGTKTIKIGVY